MSTVLYENTGVNLCQVNLQEANLQEADLQGADLPNYSILPNGRLIGWKKVSGKLIKLAIPTKTKRVNGISGAQTQES